MSSVKLIDIQVAIQNSISATFEKYNHVVGKDFLHFQDKFENHHNCKVVKRYSQTQALYSAVADISYWYELKFNNPHDITMFVLKWT